MSRALISELVPILRPAFLKRSSCIFLARIIRSRAGMLSLFSAFSVSFSWSTFETSVQISMRSIIGPEIFLLYLSICKEEQVQGLPLMP